MTCGASRKGSISSSACLPCAISADGSDLNAWIVQQGWALAYGHAQVYRSEQDEAQAAKRGIWVGTFTPPREWRQQHPDDLRRDAWRDAPHGAATYSEGRSLVPDTSWPN